MSRFFSLLPCPLAFFLLHYTVTIPNPQGLGFGPSPTGRFASEGGAPAYEILLDEADEAVDEADEAYVRNFI